MYGFNTSSLPERFHLFFKRMIAFADAMIAFTDAMIAFTEIMIAFTEIRTKNDSFYGKKGAHVFRFLCSFVYVNAMIFLYFVCYLYI